MSCLVESQGGLVAGVLEQADLVPRSAGGLAWCLGPQRWAGTWVDGVVLAPKVMVVGLRPGSIWAGLDPGTAIVSL